MNPRIHHNLTLTHYSENWIWFLLQEQGFVDRDPVPLLSVSQNDKSRNWWISLHWTVNDYLATSPEVLVSWQTDHSIYRCASGTEVGLSKPYRLNSTFAAPSGRSRCRLISFYWRPGLAKKWVPGSSIISSPAIRMQQQAAMNRSSIWTKNEFAQPNSVFAPVWNWATLLRKYSPMTPKVLFVRNNWPSWWKSQSFISQSSV